MASTKPNSTKKTSSRVEANVQLGGRWSPLVHHWHSIAIAMATTTVAEVAGGARSSQVPPEQPKPDTHSMATSAIADSSEVAGDARSTMQVLQRRDLITRHQFALHLIRDSTVIPNYYSQLVAGDARSSMQVASEQVEPDTHSAPSIESALQQLAPSKPHPAHAPSLSRASRGKAAVAERRKHHGQCSPRE